jgi:transcription initiation factor IIE alpha subunit
MNDEMEDMEIMWGKYNDHAQVMERIEALRENTVFIFRRIEDDIDYDAMFDFEWVFEDEYPEYAHLDNLTKHKAISPVQVLLDRKNKLDRHTGCLCCTTDLRYAFRKANNSKRKTLRSHRDGRKR